jgi:hypothetical protein
VVGGMAFLPSVDAGYDQLPYIEIDRAEYERRAGRLARDRLQQDHPLRDLRPLERLDDLGLRGPGLPVGEIEKATGNY